MHKAFTLYEKCFQIVVKSNAIDNTTIAMANLPIRVFEDNAAAIRYGINPSSQSF